MDINILKYFDKDSIILDLKQKSKKNILSVILDHLITKKKIKKADKPKILKTLLQREEMGSTAIGGAIAFPHARLDMIENVVICFAVSSGVDFDSLDQEPVSVIALLLSNQKEAGLHLKILALLARMLRDKYLVQKIKAAANAEDVLALIVAQEQMVR